MLFPLIFALLFLPLAAMEPERISMGDETSQATETTSLIPKSIKMKNKKTHLYDGMRQFYDRESHNQAIRKMIKTSLCDCCVTSLVIGFLVGFMGECLASWVLACTGNSTGCCIFKNTGGIFVEFGIFSIPPSCGLTGTCFMGCSLYDLIHLQQTSLQHAEINLQQNPFSSNELIWLKKASISKILIESKQKKCCASYLVSFRNCLNCTFCRMKKMHNNISQRLLCKNAFAKLLAYRLKKKYGLNKDLLKIIFKLIPSCDQYFISHNELFHLTNNTNQYYELKTNPSSKLSSYFRVLLLAQHGWISLKQSEKYPIPCNKKYLDLDQLTQKSKNWYYPLESPEITIYLPFSRSFAKYYKFEEDPAYKAEYKQQSNEQITKLLIKRTQYLSQKQLPISLLNNNNDNEKN